MIRLPHLAIPVIPQHIVQRGNDRQPCFADTADFLHYRQEPGEAAMRHGCRVHAYVLMTNHVHLLVTPPESGAVSCMMQAIGRRYVACFNARYRRTSTLWEGRFKAALVDSEHRDEPRACSHGDCARPIPLVQSCLQRPWPTRSAHHASSRLPAIGRHHCRAADRPRQLFESPVASQNIADIRVHTQQQRAWGSDKFRRAARSIERRAATVRP